MKSEFLQSMGLTNSEIKVYKTLLPEGSMEAKTIYKISGVPYGKIYDILYSLNRKGMVNIQYSRPKLFQAVEPGAALKNLLDAKDKELDKLVMMAPNAEEELNKLYQETNVVSPFWTVMMDKEPSTEFLKRVFSETKKEALLYFNKPPSIVNQVQKGPLQPFNPELLIPSLTNLFERGIDIKVLLGKVSEEMIDFHKVVLSQFNEFKNFQIRITTIVTNPFLIIDSKKVIFNIWDPLSDDNIFIASIYLWNQELAFKMKNQFNDIWQGSKKLPNLI